MNGLSRRLLQGVVRSWVHTALDPARPVHGQRRMIAMAARLLPPPRGVRKHAQTLADMRGFRFEPTEIRRPGTVLYLHGGGFVLGSPSTHCNIASRLAQRCQLPVVLPEYRLAPEARWPSARDDACRAWQALVDAGTDPAHIVVAGDSAGAGLALAVAQHAVASKGRTPAALLCFSPWVDLSLGGATLTSLASTDPMLSPQWLAWAARTYLGGHPAEAPTASPLFGDMRGLPPTLVQVAGREVLLDDAIRLAEAIRAAGGKASLQIEPHLWHVWQMFAGVLPAADAALSRAADFVDQVLPTPAKQVAEHVAQ
ncbi:MAG: alpha/beta hydrolase [Gammaproteobacteria bacterium]